jgi:predicted dehydrogenase
MNQSIHAIDLLLWFVGDVQEVYAYMDTVTHTGIQVEDVAVACLRFKNGALGMIQGTTSAYPGFPKKIEIYGSEGSVIVEEDRLLAWEFKTKEPDDDRIRSAYGKSGAVVSGASDALAISHLGHQALFSSFIASVRGQAPVLIDGPEGARAVTLIESIYRSAREKRPIRLE